MTNAEFLKQLEEIKWIENISKNAVSTLEDIADARKNPDARSSICLVEEIIDECDGMYDLYSVLYSNIVPLADDDLTINEVEHLCDENYVEVQPLLDAVNKILKDKGIEKAYYTFPREDQTVWFVYKPISVYNEAVKRNIM